jgi:hypothetical protein
MSDEANTANAQPSPQTDAPVRSTQGVLVVLGLIVLVPLVALAIAFLPRGGGGIAADLVDSLDTDKVQAVYLTDDIVYFGLVGEAHGDFFELKDAFYLRSSQADGKDDDSAPQVVPVPVSQEVGGDGDLRVNAREVVRMQALDDDSEIAKAIS